MKWNVSFSADDRVRNGRSGRLYLINSILFLRLERYSKE